MLVILGVSFLGGENGAGTDVGKMNPVEAMCLVKIEGEYHLITDTWNLGTGETIATAITSLIESSSAEIFLDTAEYLLVTRECETDIGVMGEYLRPSCRVCILDGEPDMEAVAVYLSVHKPKVTLASYVSDKENLPVLRIREGRMVLVP